MSFCKLCDIQDWNDPDFLRLASDIMARMPDDANHAPKHRKLWEFTKTVQALQHFKVLTPDSVGLSVAAGSERILYYLAHYSSAVVATDIYGSGDFSYREAKADFISHPEEFAPYPYPQENLFPFSMNALSLGFTDSIFDYVFSLSSIEHFGGLKNATRAVQEMGRVLKPGGIAVVVTDCSLNGLKAHEVFLPKEIEKLIKGSGLKLVEKINWSTSEESRKHLIDMRKDELEVVPHINLKAFGSKFTSICLVLQKEEGKEIFSRAEALNYIRNYQQEEILLPKTNPIQQINHKFQSVLYRVQEKLFS